MSSMAEVVLNLARLTPGDKDFYTRWESIGPVLKNIPENREIVTVLVVDQRYEVTPHFLMGFPNLKYVCSATTGWTHLKFDPSAFGITLITLRDETVFLNKIKSVSEFTIYSMLRLVRPDGAMGNVLAGKTLGLVGLGRIGTQVMTLAYALQMKVIKFSKGGSRKHLEELLGKSDFISIHVDENPTTINLIDRELIFSCKLGAYLINTARGSICEERAIVDAVRTGRLAGAAIDVVHDASAYSDASGLNIIMTNHIAGSTIEDRIRTDQFIVNKVGFILRSKDSQSFQD
jgi:D-3-phosphoglycerate dehydrogenase / 2-oxoglutarate reductase